MLSFAIVSFLTGLFTFAIWSNNGIGNILIKMFFGVYTLWAAGVVLSLAVPALTASGLRVF